jgi:hypothetical protein
LHVCILGTKRADIIPAQQADPASYYSFIDLTAFHHDEKRGNQLSRAYTHPRARKPLQVVDRPTSFLDLGEGDAPIQHNPPHIPDLMFQRVHNEGVVSATLPSVAIGNCEREQRKPGVIDMNGPELPVYDPTTSGGTTGQGTPFSARNALQSCDLSSGIIPPYSPHTLVCLEDDRPPSYEEAADSAPVDLENTVQQFASRYSGSSYHVDSTKVVLLPSSQDSKSRPRNSVVVVSTRQAQRDYRPLPPIPSLNQTHVYLTTPLDAGEQPPPVDELDIVPAKSLPIMEEALFQRIERGTNVDHSKVQLS